MVNYDLASNSHMSGHSRESGATRSQAATAISSANRHFVSFESRLAALCDAHGAWLHVLLNLYDGGTRGQHASCVQVSQWAGFKVRFWKHALSPSRLRHYTHVWLFDSDLDVAPSNFALPTMLRMMHAINVSIITPAPYGADAGLYSYWGPRCRGSRVCRCTAPHAYSAEELLDVDEPFEVVVDDPTGASSFKPMDGVEVEEL